MESASPKRLTEIRNGLERGVFLAVYRSRTQRIHRAIACFLLGIKHGLRGILFSWPLYLLPLAAWLLQVAWLPLIAALLLPGLLISGMILHRGVRADYARLVDGCILRPGYPGRLLFPSNQRR